MQRLKSLDSMLPLAQPQISTTSKHTNQGMFVSNTDRRNCLLNNADTNQHTRRCHLFDMFWKHLMFKLYFILLSQLQLRPSYTYFQQVSMFSKSRQPWVPPNSFLVSQGLPAARAAGEVIGNKITSLENSTEADGNQKSAG